MAGGNELSGRHVCVGGDANAPLRARMPPRMTVAASLPFHLPSIL